MLGFNGKNLYKFCVGQMGNPICGIKLRFETGIKSLPFNVNLSLALIVCSVFVGQPPVLQIYSSICSSVG